MRIRHLLWTDQFSNYSCGHILIKFRSVKFHHTVYIFTIKHKYYVNVTCSYQVLCNRKAAGKFVSSALCWCDWPQRGWPLVQGSPCLWYSWRLSALLLEHSMDHGCIWLGIPLVPVGNAWEQCWKRFIVISHDRHCSPLISNYNL